MSHDAKLNLHQRMLNVMRQVTYVQKDVTVSNAKGVARDAVVAAIRAALLNNGVIAGTSQVNGRYIESTQKSSSGTPLTIYSGTYRTTFVNVDVPTETLSVEHEAQGNDYGDKAPGKAATYAEKLNLVKGLLLETGIADEGRNPGDGDAPFDKVRINALKEVMVDAKTAPALREALKAAMTEAKEAGDTDAYNDFVEFGKRMNAKLPAAVALPTEKAAAAPAKNQDAEGPDTDRAAKRGPPASATMVKMLRKALGVDGAKLAEADILAQYGVEKLDDMDKVEVAEALKGLAG